MCKLYRETLESMGYMKSWKLIFFERVASCTSKCCRSLCSPSSTWILQCSSPHINSAKLGIHFLRILISFPRAEEIAGFGLVQSPKMNVNPINQWVLRIGSTPFPVWGRSSSFYTFFQDCVRGQHICLAEVERLSSRTKTSEFWSLLTLFLR